MILCSLCERPHKAKGLCKKHYYCRWRILNKSKTKQYHLNWVKKNPSKAISIWRKARKKAYNTEKNTARAKKYRGTLSGKESVRRAVKKYETIHPERKNAWHKAQKLKQEPCIKCGKLPTHRHHPDITKPLEVIFLCPLHHKSIEMI